MPDGKTKVTVNPDSGQIKAVVPAQPTGKPATDTRVTVTPGTGVHEALVEDVPHEDFDAMPDTEQPSERRRQQTPVVMNVQQPSAGLTGWRAQVANMTGVGAIMIFAFLMYRDLQSNQKEFLTITREERREDRSESQASQAAMVVALTGLTASNNAMVSEMRQARQEMSALVKIMTAKETKEQGFGAPMPRVKGDANGSE